MKVLHPKTIKMEHFQGNVPCQHTVDETEHRFLVVVGGKGGGQPQPVGPRLRQCGLSCQVCVSLQHLFHGRAVNKKVVQRLPVDGEAHLIDVLTANLKGDELSMVYKHSVAVVR